MQSEKLKYNMYKKLEVMQPRIKNKSKLEWTIPDCSPNEVLPLWLIDTVCHLLVKKKKRGGGGDKRDMGLIEFFTWK